MLRIAITGVSGDVGRGAIAGLRAADAERALGGRPWLLGLDGSERCEAYARVDAHLRMPPVRDPRYVEALADALVRHRIDLLIPGIDPEILVLSRARQRIAATGASLVIPPEELVEATDDKLATGEFLAARGIPYAETWPAIVRGAGCLPLVAKPRRGNASLGVRVLRDESEILAFVAERNEDYCLQRFLDGPEITVGLLYDRQGTLRDALAMERVLVDGRTARGEVVDTPALGDFVRRFGERVRGLGAVNVQLRVDRDLGPVAFEVNARLSGSTELRVALGFNDPLRIAQHFGLGLPIEAATVTRGARVRRESGIEVS